MISSWNETIVIERQKPQKLDHGKPIVQAPTRFPIKASVQRLSAREVLQLTEAMRTHEIVKVYTAFKLQGLKESATIRPDVFEWEDARYQIDSVERWQQRSGLKHYKATAIKVPNPT